MGEQRHVAVIGGGAAGLTAAIAAAREGAAVIIFEAAGRVGQKILKTGNGRCNLTNAQVLPADYHEPHYVAPLIEAWPSERVLGFFSELGLVTLEEDEGRIYPFSNTASSVLDVLRDACARLDVQALCEREVIAIECRERDFELACADGSTYTADRVIVATGGATSLLARVGHEMAPFHPVLCPLKTDTRALKGLSGVRTYAKVSAYDAADADEAYSWLFGEVLFRDYGLSGIVIFDMSREVDEGDYLGLDFLPQATEEQCEQWLNETYRIMCKCADEHNTPVPTYSELLRGVFHARLANAILRMAGCKPSQLASQETFAAIAHAVKDFRLQVTGFGNVKQAQVTRGGASMDEFDALTLESRLRPGLFAAGEVLDVDGRCGGFNLHWAWASGLAAGAAAALDD